VATTPGKTENNFSTSFLQLRDILWVLADTNVKVCASLKTLFSGSTIIEIQKNLFQWHYA